VCAGPGTSPWELLQGKGCHVESLAVLRRQGAIKVKGTTLNFKP